MIFNRALLSITRLKNLPSIALKTKVLQMVSLVNSNAAIEVGVLEPREGWLQSWLPFLRWTPTSPVEVKEAEENILQFVQTSSEGFYVNIGMVNGTECRIWTRKFGLEGSGVPLVMVHGMGAGLTMFALNYDSLAKERTVYAIDLPGFGRSSRIQFSSDPGEIEEQYTTCIEQWRKLLGLEKINLHGHSFGGHLTALYALKYPRHLNLAILADPWGMTERPTEVVPRRNIPLWVKALGSVLQHFNPLRGLRASGPAGPWLVTRMRPDLMRKYEDLLGTGKSHLISEYIFHCNGHSPTGESAFHRLMTGFGWANNPILPRLKELDGNVHMKVIYGSKSWMTHLQEKDFTAAGVEAGVDVEYVEDAGHHVYADQYVQFNDAVNKSLAKHDNK